MKDELRKLISEYMRCNQAIAYAKMEAGSYTAAVQETADRDRKANEICTFLLNHWSELFPAQAKPESGIQA